METRSTHILAEYLGCSADLLDDLEAIERLMKRAARAAGAAVVGSTFHRFSPQGVSGVVVVEESHLSIHTWPEYGYAAVDIFTCGECRPEAAHDVLARALGAERAETMHIERGGHPGGRMMRVASHREARASGREAAGLALPDRIA